MLFYYVSFLHKFTLYVSFKFFIYKLFRCVTDKPSEFISLLNRCNTSDFPNITLQSTIYNLNLYPRCTTIHFTSILINIYSRTETFCSTILISSQQWKASSSLLRIYCAWKAHLETCDILHTSVCHVVFSVQIKPIINKILSRYIIPTFEMLKIRCCDIL